MSRDNITELTEIPGDEPIVIITFDTNSGPRTYLFTGSDAVAVSSGADPQQLGGQEVDSAEEVLAITGALSGEALEILEKLL